VDPRAGADIYAPESQRSGVLGWRDYEIAEK